MIFTDYDVDQVTLTLYGEARGETWEGQRAIVHVILNRYAHPGWWSRQQGDGIPDDTLAAVCRDPYQFSCWNPSDKNSAILRNPNTLKKPEVQRLRRAIEQELESPGIDPTHGATHYCTRKVAPYTGWAKGRKPVKIIGNHQFYKIGLS